MIQLGETVEKIESILDALSEALDEYGKRMSESTRAESEWKVARARMLLLARHEPELKSADQRDAWVLDQLDKEYVAHLTAQARADTQRERMRTLRDLLGGYQTLNATMRNAT